MRSLFHSKNNDFKDGRRVRDERRNKNQFAAQQERDALSDELQVENKRAERLEGDLLEIKKAVRQRAVVWREKYKSPFHNDLTDPSTFETVMKLLNYVDTLFKSCQNPPATSGNTAVGKANPQQHYGNIQDSAILRWQDYAQGLNKQITALESEKNAMTYSYEMERKKVEEFNVRLINSLNIRDKEQRVHTEKVRSLELECSRRIENERWDMQKELESEKYKMLEQYEEMDARHGEELNRIENQHAEEVSKKDDEYRMEVDRIRDERSFEIARHEATIGDLHRQIDSLCEEATKKSAEMQQEHERAMREIQAEKADEIKGLLQQIEDEKRQHIAQMDQMKSNYEKMETRMKQDHSDEQTRLAQLHEDDISKLRASHAANLERLEQTYKRIKAEAAEYSQALLQRDARAFDMLEISGPGPLSDSDITSRFMSLKQDVDGFARLQWKPNPKYWGEELLRRLSTNQRSLRKSILQDCFWDLLYRYIFCSPFRVFGPEGQNLEAQWNEECGKGQFISSGIIQRY